MNLFCFSLEGSMDSLYEPVHNTSGAREHIIPSRMRSRAILPEQSSEWHGSVPAFPVELSQPCRTRSIKKKKKTLSPKSTSGNEALAHISDSLLKDDSPVTSRTGPAKKPEKKPGEDAQQRVTENDVVPVVQMWSPEPRPGHQSRGSAAEFPLPWDIPHHTCRRPLTEHHMCNYGFTLPRSANWEKFEYLLQERHHRTHLAPSRITHSITDLHICDQRSTSFGRFDTFRNHPSPSKPEENGGTLPVEGESEIESCDQSKHGSIGKKMKAISLTMRKKMGRKYVKAYSEEMADDVNHEGEEEGEAEGSRPLGSRSRRTSNSLESLNSGQSSSSGVTNGSDSSTNRDSLRLEEDVPYTGHFCGRARVHTDFVPSPYDADSLKLKVGDVIDIISKPPMGIWTGMLNNKVGNFKFIYVDIIVQKEAEPEKVRPQRQSKHLQSGTLQELLEGLHLEEYTSSLLLNGYQTVEDLRDLKEKHLIELNMMDPDHRHRLLAAVEGGIDTETQGENETAGSPRTESQSDSPKLDDDCPRDSGCYITSEPTDNGREDTGSHPSTLS